MTGEAVVMAKPRTRQSHRFVAMLVVGAASLMSPPAGADIVWHLNSASTGSTYGQLVNAGPPVPPISRAMVLSYADTLELNDEQRRLVLELHAAFVDGYRRDWLENAELLADDEARHNITQFRSTSDGERMELEHERIRERLNALSG